MRVSVCHCLSCQRRSGSAFAAQARFGSESVHVVGEHRAYVRISDEGDERSFHFCPECGATVFYTIPTDPDLVAVPVGVFEDPLSLPPPIRSIYEVRMHPWLALTGELEHWD